MFYVPQLPCYKIYKKANNAMQIVCFENENNMGHFHQECVGDFLIRFLEMDLTEYIERLNQFGEGTQFRVQLLFEQGYRKTKDALLDTADLLSSNLHLHRLLVGAMQMLFNNEALTDLEQLEKAYLELLYVVQMYNQFSMVIDFCLGANSYPELGVARKLASFLQSSQRFRSYKFQTGYGILPVDKYGNLDYDTVQQMNVADADLETQFGAVQNERGGVHLVPFTWILSFSSELAVELKHHQIFNGDKNFLCVICAETSEMGETLMDIIADLRSTQNKFESLQFNLNLEKELQRVSPVEACEKKFILRSVLLYDVNSLNTLVDIPFEISQLRYEYDLGDAIPLDIESNQKEIWL